MATGRVRVFFNGLRDAIRSRRESVPQAAAMVVRIESDGPEVLLVSSRREPNRWTFPKGRVERGETPEECALRELSEEAGVQGELVAYIGAVQYSTPKRFLRVDLFLVRPAGTGERERGRKVRWCKYDEALQALSATGFRQILQEAWPHVVELAAGSERAPRSA